MPDDPVQKQPDSANPAPPPTVPNQPATPAINIGAPPMPPDDFSSPPPTSNPFLSEQQTPGSDSGSQKQDTFIIPPVITTTPPTPSRSKAKIVGSILAFLILVIGIPTGILLVSQNQELRERADDNCCDTNGDGVIDGNDFADTDINDERDRAEDELENELEDDTNGDGVVDGDDFSDSGVDTNGDGVVDKLDDGFPCCEGEEGGQIIPPPEDSNDNSNGGNEPGDGSSDNSGTGPTTTTAECRNISFYNAGGTRLSQSDLTKLKAGDTIKIGVGGSTNNGAIDRARFKINNSFHPSSNGITTKDSSTGEFYINYQIPENITTFRVEAELHHTNSGVGNGGWF